MAVFIANEDDFQIKRRFLYSFLLKNSLPLKVPIEVQITLKRTRCCSFVNKILLKYLLLPFQKDHFFVFRQIHIQHILK